jgi:hypothetical protein
MSGLPQAARWIAATAEGSTDDGAIDAGANTSRLGAGGRGVASWLALGDAAGSRDSSRCSTRPLQRVVTTLGSRRLRMMNRYGRMAYEYTRRYRPAAFAGISNPEVFFAEAGEEMQAAISRARDEMLGEQGPGEGLEEYVQRSSQALQMAEDAVLADNRLLGAAPEMDPDDLEGDLESDPELAEYYRDLAKVNRVIKGLYSPWTRGPSDEETTEE